MNNLTPIALAAALVVPVSVSASSSLEFSQRPIKGDNGRVTMNFSKRNAKKPAKAPECLDLIEHGDLPNGRVIELTQSGEAYKLFWGEPVYTQYSGVSTEMVEGEDGYVYLKNPMSQFTTDSYIKGKKVGNTYEFELPRIVFPADRLFGSGSNDFLTLLQYSDTDKTYYPANLSAAKEAGLPEIDNKLVLTINADGSISYKTDENYSVIFGLVGTRSEAWNGYAEINCTWRSFNDVPVTPPAGLVTEEMSFLYDATGHYVKLGYDNDDVYIQGMFETLPDAWVKGHKDGSKITIPTGQYLGYYDYDNSQTYCTTVIYETAEDPTTGELRYYYDLTDELVFDVDEKGNLSAPGQGFLYTPGGATTYYYGMHSPRINHISENLNPKPAAPYNLIFFDAGSPDIPHLQFTLPNVNVDGELLNVNNLLYCIYVDGEQYTFKPDLYKSIDFNKRYIPFAMHDGYDFFVRDFDRLVYFYFRGNETFGVQLVNIDPATQAIIGESEIATIEAKPSTEAVDSIVADKEIKDVKYFNLAGYEVANPDNGIYIKVVTYVDGTTDTTKVVK